MLDTKCCCDIVQQCSRLLSFAGTLIHTYKTFVNSIIDYRFICLGSAAPKIVEWLRSKGRVVSRRLLWLDRFHPSREMCELEFLSFVKRVVEQKTQKETQTLTNHITCTFSKPVHRPEGPTGKDSAGHQTIYLHTNTLTNPTTFYFVWLNVHTEILTEGMFLLKNVMKTQNM